jgi:hypothetical protein
MEEWRYISTHFSTSALDGVEWLASIHRRFTPRKRASSTHWIGGWVGPRAVLDAAAERKTHSPPGVEPQNPEHPVRSPALYNLCSIFLYLVSTLCIPLKICKNPILRIGNVRVTSQIRAAAMLVLLLLGN